MGWYAGDQGAQWLCEGVDVTSARWANGKAVGRRGSDGDDGCGSSKLLGVELAVRTHFHGQNSRALCSRCKGRLVKQMTRVKKAECRSRGDRLSRVKATRDPDEEPAGELDGVGRALGGRSK